MSDIIGVFIDILNPLTIILMVLAIVIGVFLGMMFRPKAGNRVIKFLPTDKRFIEFDVQKEYAFSVHCKPKKGYPPQRFIKIRSGYTGIVGKFMKKAATLFLGIEATAFTKDLETGDLTVPNNGNPSGLAIAVKSVIGDELYDKMPLDKKEALEKSKVNVTVKLDESKFSDIKRKVSEEDLKTEDDVKASETFWRGKKLSEGRQYLDLIFVGGTGFGVALALQILGILKI